MKIGYSLDSKRVKEESSGIWKLYYDRCRYFQLKLICYRLGTSVHDLHHDMKSLTS